MKIQAPNPQAMSPARMDDLIARMRDLQQQASGTGNVPGDVERAPTFAETLARSIEQVNATQRNAQRLATAFERGDRGVDIVQVMVATQKAGLAVPAMSEVRNHVVRAYQDVMSMPV